MRSSRRHRPRTSRSSPPSWEKSGCAPAIDKLKDASIPNFSYPELAVKAFKRLSDQQAWKTRGPGRALDLLVQFRCSCRDRLVHPEVRASTRWARKRPCRSSPTTGSSSRSAPLARTSREAAEQAVADRLPGGDEDIVPGHPAQDRRGRRARERQDAERGGRSLHGDHDRTPGASCAMPLSRA